MIRYSPSVWFGTLNADATRIAFQIPKRERGVVIRSLDLFTTTGLGENSDGYWILGLGRVVGEMEFVGAFFRGFPGGIAKGRNSVVLPKFVPYDSGEFVAVRLAQSGSPSDLTEAQVVVGVEEP